MGLMFRLIEERNGSAVTGETHCNRCGACCLTSPCQLKDLEDVRRIARHLGTSVADVAANHLSEEVIRSQFGVSRVVTTRVGSNGVCEFYDDVARSCALGDAKPTGGKAFKCWTIEGRSLPPFDWSASQRIDLHALRGGSHAVRG